MPQPADDPVAYRLATAERAIANNWSVIPVRGKKPMLKNWTSLPVSTPEQARAWAADYNIGLRTGHISGIYVIDVDIAKGGDATSLNLPPTLTVETGGGGLQFYYAMPPDLHLGNTASNLGPHIDTRGDGGQVVMPGSIHPDTGCMYRWSNDLPIVPLPAHVIAALTARPQPVAGPGHITGNPYARAALDKELTQVAAAPEGSRNDTLNRAAFSLFQLVAGGQLNGPEVEAALLSAAASAGLKESEARATIASGAASGKLHPRRPVGRPAVNPKPAPVKPTPSPDDHRKEILIPGPFITDDGEYVEVGVHEFVRNVLEGLPEGTLYSRGGLIGELVGPYGQVEFRPVAARRMQAVIDSAVRLIQWNKPRGKNAMPEKVYVSCTRDLAETVLGSAQSFGAIRQLKMLVNYPVYLPPDFHPAPPGWDAMSGVYYDRPENLMDINPVTDEVIIRQTLSDLIVDFPFDGDSSRANFIGLLLTPILRPALQGNTPLHLIESSIERAGKGKLIEQVVGRIILGGPVASMQYQDNEAERDKTILSLLLGGCTIIHLDNLNGFIDSASLSALVTAASYRGRVLGHSATATVENIFTIVGTGNNVRMSSELIKRTIPIVLRPETDHPEYRTDFTHPDLPGYLSSCRPKVLGCLLGMIENWRAGGSQTIDTIMPLGGFESWASTIGAVLFYAGFSAWRKSTDSWRATADVEGEDLRTLVEAWSQKGTIGSPWKTAEVFSLAEELDVFSIFRVGKSRDSAEIKFGMRVLKQYENRPVNDYRITRYPGTKRGIWTLSLAKKS